MLRKTQAKVFSIILVVGILLSGYTFPALAVAADKAALTAAIDAEYSNAERTILLLNQQDYTTSSWSAYIDALDNAIAVESDVEATQDTVDLAAGGISAAKASLVFAGLSDLNASKDAAAAKQQEFYTPESWSAFQNDLTNALALPESTNAEIVSKTSAIRAAIQELVFQLYSITYDSQGGSSVNGQNVVYNSLLTRPSNPTWLGYDFGGWYTEPECTNMWDFASDRVTGDLTLYAMWAQHIIKITLNANSGSVSPTTVSRTYNSSYGTLPVPTRTGYTFLGWYTGAGGTGTKIASTTRVTNLNNHTLYAGWKANSCSITFNSMGGSAVSPVSALYDSKLTQPAAPVRAGYVFAGWYKESTYKTVWNFSVNVVKGSMTLYARWTTAPKVTITATANNALYGTVTGGGQYFNDKVTKATLTAYPKAGYRFVRWAVSGSTVSTTYQYAFVSAAARTVVAEFAPIGVPVATVAVKSYNSVQISWNSVTGVVEYEVYRATSATGTFAKIATVKGLTYLNTSLTTNTAYYYKVRAKCTAGSTITYGTYSATKNAKPVLGSTTSLKVSAVTATSVTLAWAAVDGANGYELYRGATATGTFAKVKETTTLTAANTGLKVGTTYYFKVRAYRTVGTARAYGGYSSVIPGKPAPAAPSSVKASVGPYKIVISWAAVTGATKYEIYRAVGTSTTYSFLKESSTTSYANTGLNAGTKYSYKVRAYTLVGSTKVYGPFSVAASGVPRTPLQPDLHNVMNSTTYSSTSYVLMVVYNYGSLPLRILKSGYLYDNDYASYDRELQLIDSQGKDIQYQDIPAGTSMGVIFRVIGNPTWYDKYSRVYYTFTYDSIQYICGASYYWGEYYQAQ